MNRKILLFILLIAALMLVAYLFVKNYNSYTNISIKYGNAIDGVSLSISNEQNSYEVAGSSEIRVKKGVYSIKSSGSPDYDVLDYETEFKQGTNNLEINPSYTKEKLATLLGDQETAIQSVITKNVNLGSNYRLSSGELFGHGEWYGAVIIPNISNEELETNYFDVFRVALKKSNDSWVLSTSTPELVLTKVRYPDIPVDILSKVNRLYYNDIDVE